MALCKKKEYKSEGKSGLEFQLFYSTTVCGGILYILYSIWHSSKWENFTSR